MGMLKEGADEEKFLKKGRLTRWIQPIYSLSTLAATCVPR
jgi:hypothetical protein